MVLGVANVRALCHKPALDFRRPKHPVVEERGRSSVVEHNLAKVGVESSNLFARSNFRQEIEAIKAVLRDRFLLPAPSEGLGEARRKHAEAQFSAFRRATSELW